MRVRKHEGERSVYLVAGIAVDSDGRHGSTI
jgi:hypothetical protein